jgi:hypothetical protein
LRIATRRLSPTAINSDKHHSIPRSQAGPDAMTTPAPPTIVVHPHTGTSHSFETMNEKATHFSVKEVYSPKWALSLLLITIAC